jgi:hypothetical protein
MTDRLTAVPPLATDAVVRHDDGPHPMEVARKALREAALVEGPPLRGVLLRLADGLPPRGDGQ